jgi:hypothetical protein
MEEPGAAPRSLVSWIAGGQVKEMMYYVMLATDMISPTVRIHDIEVRY